MTRIIVLRREPLTPSFDEELHSLFERVTGPHGLISYEHVNIDGQPVVVCTLTRGRSAWTSGEVSLIVTLLGGEIPIASVVIELDPNACVRAAQKPLFDEWTERVMEAGETADGHLDCGE